MINLTENIIILEKENLFKETKLAFKSALEFYNKEKEDNYFVKIIKKYEFKNFDLKFLNECIDFISNPKSENIYVKYGFADKNILLYKPILRNGTRLLLINLWRKKIILLPLKFNLSGLIFNEEESLKFENKIIMKLKKSLNSLENPPEYFKNKYITNITKIIRATNYADTSDATLDELNRMHIFILKAKRRLVKENIPSINYFMENLISDINKYENFEDFNELEYKQWLHGFFSRHKELSYLEYLKEKNNLKEYRREYVNEQTKERNKKYKKEIEEDYDIELIKEDDFSIEAEFLRICKENKLNWVNSIPVFSDYNIDQPNDCKIWVELYQKYIENRKNNGYETEKTSNNAFNFLMNYIFFYLRLWNSKNEEKTNIPLTPKDFHRVLYVNKSFTQNTEYFTIKDILNKSYGSLKSRNIKLRNIKMFFDFIIDFYEEDPEIWQSGNKNPIRKNDFYIERSSLNKTNKEIIPKEIYSKFKKYLYSVEYFGEYLLEKSINENINLSVSVTDFINSEDYGMTPIFFDKGKIYPIKHLPNLYLFRERTFDKNNIFSENNEPSIITKKIVCNTVIRATILMFNTGLRAAQVSWLDRENWNLNKGDKVSAYYKINVNTDKTKEHAWTSFVAHNVYLSMLKETMYQNAIKDENIDKYVNYQNRENTRFKNILPLFRGYSKTALPVDFRQYWTTILWSFQNNLNNIDSTNYQLIKLEKPENDRIDLIGIERLRYSPLSIKAIYTPHSMRATFCTHMAEYLERTEIAALVGHQSELITSNVYIKPEENTIIRKMSEAVDIFDNEVNADYFNKDSVAHIKPNLEKSSLQKAFLKDRDQTIELFNITSISMNINKDSEEQSKKAINLLKNARMDHVIFETTHICPVGGICPQEVMAIITEQRRCGLCPLALKCIDNLNPIYAKQRDLIREIKEGKEKLDNAIKNKESNITINNIEDKVNLDIRELVSWKFSADILSQHYENIKDNKDLEKKYYVEMPDMVKNHLEKVSVSNEKEYLLTRIADANAYSIYNTNEIKYQSEMIKRGVIKNLGLFEYDDYYVSDDEKVETFCAMIHNMMQSNGVGLNKLVEYDCFKAIDNQKVKIKNLGFNAPIKLENKKG